MDREMIFRGYSSLRRDIVCGLFLAVSCACASNGAEYVEKYRTLSHADPEEVGLERAPLERMTAALRNGEYPNVHAVLIAKDGLLVYEEYFDGVDRRLDANGDKVTVPVVFHRDSLHDVRSVGKSVTSAIVGIAHGEEAIRSLEMPLVEFFPEHAGLASAENRRITLRHALTMTAGLEWNEQEIPYTDPRNDAEQLEATADPAKFVLARSVATGPGSTYAYNSGLPTLMGLVVGKATETSFGAYARRVLFDPLGITEIEWDGPRPWIGLPELKFDGSEDWSRVAHPAGSLWIRARDLATFGTLYLNEGRWNGRQIVPSDWIIASTRRRVGTEDSLVQYAIDLHGEHGYGYYWYHDRYRSPGRDLEVLRASGNGGQRIWVVPGLDMVVIHFTGRYNQPDASWIAEKLFLERIVPWALREPSRRLSRRPYVHGDDWTEAVFGSRDLGRYVGTYDHDGQWIQVWETAGRLRMTPLAGDLSGPIYLVPVEEDVFAFGFYEDGTLTKIYWPNGRLEFEVVDGRAVRYLDRSLSGHVYTKAERLPR